MLERAPRWKRFGEYCRGHQGLILFIVILVLLLFLALMIMNERDELTGNVVKDENVLVSPDELKTEKVSYDDVHVTSTP